MVTFSASQGFKEYADALLRRSLQKGIPPLFVMLKPFYTDVQKVNNFYFVIKFSTLSLKMNYEKCTIFCFIDNLGNYFGGINSAIREVS